MGPSELPIDVMANFNQFRLDDIYLVVMVVATLAFCIVHAARRAFRQPYPTEEPVAAPSKEKVAVKA